MDRLEKQAVRTRKFERLDKMNDIPTPSTLPENNPFSTSTGHRKSILCKNWMRDVPNSGTPRNRERWWHETGQMGLHIKLSWWPQPPPPTDVSEPWWPGMFCLHTKLENLFWENLNCPEKILQIKAFEVFCWASLVVQWLRICLLMQGTRVRALVWEDPTCCGAIRPVSHNYWACASGACALQQERPR